MNVLKKVKEFLENGKSLENFGIQSAVPKSQVERISTYISLAKNPGKLALPAVISSEIARLTALEFKSAIIGGERAKFLDLQYQGFLPKIREVCETACMLGGVVLKPYVSDGRILVTAVAPDMFIPTELDAYGDVRGGVFIDRIFKNGKVFTRLEAHSFKMDSYIIENKCFSAEGFGMSGKEVPLSMVDEWRSIKPKVTITGLKKPLFAYFKMPTSTAELPLGEAVFAKAVKLISDAEDQYKRLLWEFESGERALYVDDAAIRQDKDGRKCVGDTRLYRLINQENLFSDWTPELREASIINGLNEILRRIEFNSGLAYGTISRVDSSDKTAEEIRSSKQRSYAKVVEIQSAMKFALTDLISAMNALCDLYSLTKSGEYSVSFEFDDSIIADRNREFDEKMTLFEAGIVSKEEIREWYFGK